MDGIFFLVLAFFTMFLSIKLSFYGDALSKQTKLGSALIGGLLIASITSLPELVTSISAVLINNPSLSFGDILGSDMFNIFVLAVYNIWFFKKDIFKNTDSKYKYECAILLIEYLFILLGYYINFVSTIVLIIMYIMYIVKVVKTNKEDTNDSSFVSNPLLKFITCSLVLIVISILLTLQADKITHIYPQVSSSTVGAILLGITTSIPEVVSTFALLKYNNNDMAISNMLGSNIFNFFILALSDFFVRDNHIYHYSDIYSFEYLIGGILLTTLLLISIIKKNKNKLYYLVISLIMSFIYLLVWYFQFK
ncbi:MAG: hypothetical protein J5970_01725 [Bacilli bacterium]|nr:hypothetical protein [Bacilli bacterium]